MPKPLVSPRAATGMYDGIAPEEREAEIDASEALETCSATEKTALAGNLRDEKEMRPADPAFTEREKYTGRPT